jgi:hypothetical protein
MVAGVSIKNGRTNLVARDLPVFRQQTALIRALFTLVCTARYNLRACFALVPPAQTLDDITFNAVGGALR